MPENLDNLNERSDGFIFACSSREIGENFFSKDDAIGNKKTLLSNDSTNLFYRTIKESTALFPINTTDLFLGIKPKSFKPKAMFWDMDATLIREESMSLLTIRSQHRNEIQQLTELAMTGQISFAESFLKRLEFLKNTPLSSIHQTIKKLTLWPQTKELFDYLHKEDIKLFLISGGIGLMAEYFANYLGFQEYLANELEVKESCLTGRLLGTIVDSERKKTFVQEMCKKYGFSKENCIAIGDGANDQHMMSNVCLKIGMNPKEALIPHINCLNTHGDHRFLIDFLKLD